MVQIVDGDRDETPGDGIGQEEYSVEVDARKDRKKRVVIYRISNDARETFAD